MGLAFQRENSGSKINKQMILRGLLGDGKHCGEETWKGDEGMPFYGEWAGWASPKVTCEQRLEREERAMQVLGRTFQAGEMASAKALRHV